MTNRISYAPQDFDKMCEQADRDHESRKLLRLMERVKRQIADREKTVLKPQPGPQPVGLNDLMSLKLPNRRTPFER
ncbi:MAG: hypothetical protein WAN03_01415 [Candidatus Sulfotelmatobacter sp.]